MAEIVSAREAFAALGVGRRGRRDGVERDEPIEPDFARAIQLPHAAGTDRVEDQVRPAMGAVDQGHEGTPES